MEDGLPPFDHLPLHSRGRFTLVVPGQAEEPPPTAGIPVDVIVGSAPRPRVVAVAGIHGDEREGPAALAEAWVRIPPDRLAGTLVLVPVANVDAFRAGRRTSPVDDVDMNRVFPGRSDGSRTERIAHRLFTEVIAGADFVMSLHSWYRDALVVPYVECPRSGPAAGASRAAALGLGLDFVEPLDWHPGLLPAAANRAGIPAIEPEIGGLAITTRERRALYGRVLDNLLRHVGLLPPTHSGTVPPRVVTRTSIAAPAGGMLLAEVEPGAVVREGSMLGLIRDLHGDELATIVAPRQAVVAGVHMGGAIEVGEPTFTLFYER